MRLNFGDSENLVYGDDHTSPKPKSYMMVVQKQNAQNLVCRGHMKTIRRLICLRTYDTQDHYKTNLVVH